MKVFLRLVAILIELFAIFLIYAVINAFTSTAGARVGVCIAYVIGAIVLTYVASWIWRRSSRGRRRARTRPAG